MREPNEKRFGELLLYISKKCASDPKFGATKLNKILFYSDFLAYAQLGNSITGCEYQKLPHGPVPKRILAVRAALERQGVKNMLYRCVVVVRRLASPSRSRPHCF